MSRPPSSGPATSAMADTPAHRPIACACSRRSGKVAVTSASVLGSRAEPPIAWSARAEISICSLLARPHNAEANVKTTSPTRKTRLRPKRSPSAPAVSSRLANTRM